MVGRATMREVQATMARSGTAGTNGTRNGRGIPGRVRRSTITPAETMMKAASVPMLTSSATEPRGRRLAMAAVTSPTRRVPFTGVRRTGCTLPKTAGSRPSRDMA